MTMNDRIYIEKCMDNSMPFKEIAKYICKDPTTISKEVKKHRQLKERNQFNNTSIKCINIKDCTLQKEYRRYHCNRFCDNFVPISCRSLAAAPYVCNGCSRKTGCRLDKYYYKAVTANRQYKTLLSSSRDGLNITAEGLQELDEMVTPLVLQGQSLYHIVSNHDGIPCSIRTLYSYIENCSLSVKNIDLPRKVKYKPRKIKREEVKSPECYTNRSYKDFCNYMEQYPDTNVVEMDTVVGCEGSKKVMLTLFFRSSKCMLIYLLPDKTQASVRNVFDQLEKDLTTYGFAETFTVILTDRGTEFGNPEALETGIDSVMRTSIYFCDPMASWQKACIEKNHEYIRYVLPKRSSFDNLKQQDITLLANHINNTARASLNGCTPFMLATMLMQAKVIDVFELQSIAPDDVLLKPSLLKK